MNTRRLFIIFAIIALAALFSACAPKTSYMQNGYYTAEARDFNQHGWKEYLTIYVSDNKILTVEYDAYNASGFARSWDINYMRTMNVTSGTYPNAFTRDYSVALINLQDPDAVDAVSGATSSYYSFHLLAEAALNLAENGVSSVALVEIPE